MQIKSTLAAAAFTLVAGVSSISGDERYLADTAVDPDTPYSVREGVASEQMSILEMVYTRGSAGLIKVTASGNL